MHRTLIRVNSPVGTMDFYVTIGLEPANEAAKTLPLLNGRAAETPKKPASAPLTQRGTARRKAFNGRKESIRQPGTCTCLMLKQSQVASWIAKHTRAKTNAALAARLDVSASRLSSWLFSNPKKPMSHRITFGYAQRLAHVMGTTPGAITQPFDLPHVRCMKVRMTKQSAGSRVRWARVARLAARATRARATAAK